MFLQDIVEKRNNEEKIKKQKAEYETQKEKEFRERQEKAMAENNKERTRKRVEKARLKHEKIKNRFTPYIKRIWPDVVSITVYEHKKDVEALDFAGCDVLIRFKDGSVIHGALRENTGGTRNWHASASMIRRNSVLKYEGKGMQSVEIQIFKKNRQIHILDTDEVYKIAYEFQKGKGYAGYYDGLMKIAEEKGFTESYMANNSHIITRDHNEKLPPELEDAIRIKYVGFNNFKEFKPVEILHKWEKYNFKGILIEKGSEGVDIHSKYYKEKTQILETTFSEETRLVYEKEKIQEQTKEKIMTKIENIDPETIQPFKDLDDICVGYDPKAEKFAIFDERTHDVWAEVNDIDELNDILDDKIIQLLAYSSNDQALDIFEELEGLEDSEDTQEKKDKIKELKGDLNKLAGEIAETIDLEELEIQAAISRERHNGDSDSNEDSDSNGDSRTLI